MEEAGIYSQSAELYVQPVFLSRAWMLGRALPHSQPLTSPLSRMLTAAGCLVDSALPVPGLAGQFYTTTLATWLKRCHSPSSPHGPLEGVALEVTRALVQAAAAERARAASGGRDPSPSALEAPAAALELEMLRLANHIWWGDEVSCAALCLRPM